MSARRFLSALLFAAALSSLGAVACDAPDGDAEAASADELGARGSAAAGASLVTDRATLRALEGRGFGLGALLFDDPGAVTTAALHSRHAAYRSYVSVIEEDIAAARAADPSAGVDFRRYAHRLFDVRFLRSEGASFELVGVVNRIDKVTADPASCGEVRLVYRLAYPESSLPLTLNVIFRQGREEASCRAVASRWMTTSAFGAPLADALARGALADFGRGRARSPWRIETNFQAVRWPTSVTGDMGGYAEYVLRAFRLEGDAFVPAPLDNTPDVAAARAPEAKRRLVDWLKTRRADLEGERPLETPPELEGLLATKVVSVAPRGLARLANRPFSQILGDAELAELGATTPDARERLLRRLDTGTCNGCHQTRSIAGFHLLGEELSFSANDWLNKLAVGRSPHLLDEDALRSAEIAEVARGRRPTARAPAPERPAPGRSTLHAHCAIGAGAFDGWTCSEGERCEPLDDDPFVGSCERSAPASIGDACEPGHVVSSANAMTDSFVRSGERSCSAPSGATPRCATSRLGGFPGGMCIAECTRIGQVEGDAVCTKIPNDVTPCVSQGRRLLECVAATATPFWATPCDAVRTCREDYACARVAGTKPGEGACMPPYFLQQIRLDGHVLDEDPCAQKGDGPYCANARELVVCSGRRTTSTTACERSCVLAPEGQPDRCER